MKSLEKQIIDSIKEKTHLSGKIPGLGIGDDAAFLMTSSMEHNKLIIASDSLVEGVHFRLDWCGWDDIAIKLFETNASDLLVKGAKPQWALLTMNLTPEFATNETDRETFLKALTEKLLRHNVALIGGDITKSSVNTFSLTMLASSQYFIPRAGQNIEPGDLLVMAGALGGSNHAYNLLKKHLETQSAPNNDILSAYRRPSAVWENQWLSALEAKASIDQSDSFYETIEILAKENRAEIEIDLSSVCLFPFPENMPAYKNNEEKEKAILTAAEDLAQIAIVSPAVQHRFKEFSLTPIGKVVSRKEPKTVFKGFSGNILNTDNFSIFRHF